MFRSTLLFLLLLAGSASAQSSPAGPLLAPTVSQPVVVPAAATAADTVQAIRRLFAKRRRVGNTLTIGAVGADLALAGMSAAYESKGSQSGGSGGGYGNIGGNRPLFELGFGGFALVYGVVAAPVMGVGIQQLIAYGPRREAKIIAAYETSQQLPTKIQRQLRKHLAVR